MNNVANNIKKSDKKHSFTLLLVCDLFDSDDDGKKLVTLIFRQ